MGRVAAVGGDRLVSIQVLRACAALAVVVVHAQSFMGERMGATLIDPVVQLKAGVDLFFVISGFVIVYASEPLFTKAQGPAVFFVRRMARIVPLYWATTAVLIVYAVVVPGAPLLQELSVERIVASLMFFPLPGSPIHALGWTLNYEFLFYAAFAPAVLLPRVAAVVATLSFLLAMVVIGRVLELPYVLAYWSSPLILEFCFGMLIALVYRTGGRIPRPVTIAICAAALVALAHTGYDREWRWLLWGLPSAALVAALVLSRETVAREGLLTRAFVGLGNASYSLYLTHVLVFAVLQRVVPAAFPDLLLFPGLIAAAIVAALISYRFFELPITRALQARIDQAARRPPQVVRA